MAWDNKNEARKTFRTRICVIKSEEVTIDWRKLRGEELHKS
jgi:hypothetical protein